MKTAGRAAAWAFASLLGACAGDEPAGSKYTYYQDAAPILAEKCTGCHRAGDAATPFALSSYDDVYAVREAARKAVAEGTMPPWHAASGCREYLGDRSLSPRQKGVLLAWLDAGAPAGDAAAATPLAGPAQVHLSRVDATARMSEPYTPQTTDEAPDENRCFVADVDVDKLSYITGLEVEPGNPAINHHTFIWSVAPEHVTAFTALDAADPKPGYDCYGGVATGTAQARPVGGWVPGMFATEFPEGLGVPIAPGGKIVINVHYNTHYARRSTDQTGVKLKLRRNAQELFVTAISDPYWWSDGGMSIPAGEKAVSFDFSYRATLITLGLLEFTLYNAVLHMHRYGSAGKLMLERADGTTECLLDVPKFDFEWQDVYWFETPVRVHHDDRLYIQCTFDNSAENQPLVDGKLQKPVDLEWGLQSPAEMCSGFFQAAF